MALRIRYYIDADTPGLAKVLLRATPEVTYPGDPGGKWRSTRLIRPACIVCDVETKDPVWIPQVAAAGLPIITRDRHIAERRAEIRAVLSSGAKMFAITSGPESLRLLEQLEVVMCNWRRMEKKALEPGPFICSMTRTSLRQIAPK